MFVLVNVPFSGKDMDGVIYWEVSIIISIGPLIGTLYFNLGAVLCGQQ